MVASPTLSPIAVQPAAKKQHGLAFWMDRVPEECDRVAAKFAADPVHDLRVALRRCRSMADGLMTFDPDSSWKQMRKAGKKLFSSLGELRDVQVMQEWIGKLGSAEDPTSLTLLRYLETREAGHKLQAATALKDFDRKQWGKWSTTLPRRAARIRTGSLVFKHLALERWTQAYDLHRRALRSNSQVSWHALRIGVKRFRYIVENFLPEQHEAWIADLKEVQDLLGEVHDLDVLWDTALEIHGFPDTDARVRWHTKISEERSRRIQRYRDKMVGKQSLWQLWRADLPAGRQIEAAAMKRLQLWASALDPDFKHSRHVARLALQLYDGLAQSSSGNGNRSNEREILRLAALLHEVGLSKGVKRHHKASYRLIEKLPPPLGLDKDKLRMAGVVSRYHRGALPRSGQKTLVGISPAERITARKLAGILRLANAFDADHKSQIQRIHAATQNGYLQITAQGYNPRHRMAESIAAGRHLLEMISHRPIVVKSARTTRRLKK
ncbi:MAG TPA: CHAD domain-containing protein [Terriglobales bacterium]|nr:CHAD domain-containing protein [Terriglobales bacterium]